MSELRWTLLILGVVFIAALSWWERRRPRQAFAPRLREAGISHPQPTIAGEPWIGESGLAEAALLDEPFHGDADAHETGPGPLEELPTLVVADDDPRLALKALWDAHPPEPRLIDPEAGAVVATAAASDAELPILATGAPQETESAAPGIPGAEGVSAVRIVESAFGGDGAAPVEPIVEWPPEDSRRILALRLVAPQAERFAGRALRLALAAEGFLLGKFAIFHKPDEANRAVLSAAALTRPGAFDLENMDTQRYGGLSLFAVLPGPKPPPQAFEDLLCAARNLNERLEGALQDERGGPLTPLRVASIRDSLRAEDTPSAAHGA